MTDQSTINIRAPWHTDPVPEPTSTAKMDINTVFFCDMHNGCLLRDDTYEKEGEVCCRVHGVPVRDVTNSPVGKAFRTIVSPKPRKGR